MGTLTFTIIPGKYLGHRKRKKVLFDFLSNFMYRFDCMKEERHLVCFLLFAYFQEAITLNKMPS